MSARIIKTLEICMLNSVRCTIKITGRKNAPIIDPNDTYPLIVTTIENITKQIITGRGCKPKKTPVIVKTPLPPLNPAKIGQIWPILQQLTENIFYIPIHSLRTISNQLTTKPGQIL